MAGMSTTITEKDVDYSYYLGPDYKKGYKNIKKTSTIVSNHCSWLDSLILIKYITPAFAPTAYFLTVPIFGKVCSMLDSIFIDRGADEQGRQRVINTILERQKMIEETGKYAPFAMFCEGATTNGTCLLKFRRGAFVGEKRITPIYLKYPVKGFSSAYDVVNYVPLVLM